ncbi:apolipoprotein N-acyltransferase [Roseobacter sp. SK209-2-6]|uniref:apolipoprotein N-acyltransferase n=1 Tax=Roseobacter sp. SK209-2-6 TaxID=388739 RepID=UPI0003176A3A|nr:apolipoprotein N-acyltransferase [Roseobacter sp. SK209-2-6]
MISSVRIKGLWSFVLAFVLGGLLSRALAPHNDLWVLPLSLGGIGALLLAAKSWRGAAFLGWMFGTGYFAFALSWIIEPFQIDAERYAWMAPFALVFLAAGLALFWAAAFAAAANRQDGEKQVFLLIVTWSIMESARAYLLTGFPWAAFGQFWIDTPAAGLLPWIGPHGLSFLTLTAFLPLALVRARRALAALPLVLLGGVLWLWPDPPAVGYTDKTVRIVQPNAPQKEKWHPEKRWDFVRRAVGLSAAGEEGQKPDLIIWPETALPTFLEDAGLILRQISEHTGEVPLLTGIQREEDGRYYNSAVLTDKEGRPDQIYDKVHLVPFGEYVPFGNFMARFGIHGFASQAGAGYSAGEHLTPMKLPIGAALPLICYEAVFAHEVAGVGSRFDLIVQITNDAWFGTHSGPYQHLVQARMRAAEQGVPMLRAANTGISAIIDPYGRVIKSLPLGEAGALDGAVPEALAPTFYRKRGDLPFFLFTIGLSLILTRRAKKIASKS